MKIYKTHGLSIVEFMVAIGIGLFLVATFLGVYLTQTQTYRTSMGQAATQTAENIINEMVTPVIRGAGYTGCATVAQSLSNLNNGSALPLSNLNIMPAFVMGYNANSNLIQFNAANETTAGRWTPSLDAGLVGNVEAGSDVLVILSAVPSTAPIGVTTISPTSSSLIIQDASTVRSGQYAAVSDCLKTSIFKVTGVSGNTITHATGGAMSNSDSILTVSFPVGSQYVPMQQEAYFVGQGTGGQSALKKAIFDGTTWIVEPLIPGVDMMHVVYGIGSNGSITQYVGAQSVTNWSQVYAIRLSFLIAGPIGSGSQSATNPNTFTMLGNTVILPRDNRLRHPYEITVYLRNALL